MVHLNHSHFLRLNGARNIGIRTSFGVPVVSRWGVTFVIVFYSRAAVQVCCVCMRRGLDQGVRVRRFALISRAGLCFLDRSVRRFDSAAVDTCANFTSLS